MGDQCARSQANSNRNYEWLATLRPRFDRRHKNPSLQLSHYERCRNKEVAIQKLQLTQNLIRPTTTTRWANAMRDPSVGC